jgi:hypothetical protein
MPGLLSYALAGAAAGLGDGLTERAKAKREEAAAALKFARERTLQGDRDKAAMDRVQAQDAGATTRTEIQQTGANDRAGLQASTALKTTEMQQTGANDRAGLQARTAIETTEMRETGATERNDANNTTRVEIADADRTSRERIASEGNTSRERITEMTIESAEERTDRQVVTGGDGYLYYAAQGGKPGAKFMVDGQHIKAAPKDVTGSKTGGGALTAAQRNTAVNNAWDNAIETDVTGKTTLNPETFVGSLIESGIDPTSPGVQTMIRSKAREAAQKQATAEFNGNDGVALLGMRFGGTIPEGTDKDQWVKERTEEILDEAVTDIFGRVQRGISGPGPASPAPQARNERRAPQVGQTATNRETGEKVRWNGTAWEPVS